jgi:hypothetical protein
MDQNVFDYSTEASEQMSKGAEFENKIRKMLSSGTFLTATIAQTVIASVSVLLRSVNVFAVLFAIGMWMAYAVAKEASPIKGVKFLSGTLKAYYIVEIVAIVMLLVAGIIFLAVSPKIFSASEADLERAIVEAVDDEDVSDLIALALGQEYTAESVLNMIEENIPMSVSTFFGIIFVVIGAMFVVASVISFIINQFFVKKLKNFVRGVSCGLAEKRDTPLDFSGLRGWFIFFGVVASISAVSEFFNYFSIFSVASSAASAVMMFALWKLFEKKDTDNLS